MNNKFHNYDKRGVRCFVKYSTANGLFAIECYRKKTEQESEGTGDWRMIRVGHIQSYETRNEAEDAVLELAEDICKEFRF